MDITQVLQIITVSLIAVLGYFLKKTLDDLSKVQERVQKHDTLITVLQEQNNHQNRLLQNMDDSFKSLVNKLDERDQATITHLQQTIKDLTKTTRK